MDFTLQRIDIKSLKTHVSRHCQTRDRRNKIAHEADMDPSYPGARWPISETDVNKALDFIEQLCEAIHVAVV
jgi:hypothetical protein